MKIFLVLLACLLLAIVVVLLLAATKPDTIAIERSASVRSSPAVVFALLNDFRQWPRWASQDREDPTMKRTFNGPTIGLGAGSDWESKGSAGAGQMTITRSVPNELVEVQVDFQKPFAAHNVNQFQLRPEADGTRVTWSMHGTNVYLLKLISVFVSPERMMGPHFETGLANLKAEAEKASRRPKAQPNE